MKKLGALLIGILLSINTFSQQFVLDEAIIVESNTQEIVDIIKGESYPIKEVYFKIQKEKVLMHVKRAHGVDTKEAWEIEGNGIEDERKVLYCKDKNKNLVKLTFFRNGIFYVEYGKTYSTKDTELALVFVRK